MERKANFQPLAWFWDIFQRKLLDLDPPYQRRSVWNQQYKDFFVDTVLQDFPCPAIFLYEEISPDGVAKYSVVDGKQRLSTLFDFIRNEFPISSASAITSLRDKYFKDLSSDLKTKFWRYQFSVEYVPEANENLINDIFDRINRNVAKLSPQELRHAKFDGIFISEVEKLSEFMGDTLPKNFPQIATTSRRQMKDIEFAAQLALLLEEGERSYSQEDIDIAFSERDESWESKDEVVARFREACEEIKQILDGDETGQLARSRLRNQADFYSFFGAIDQILQEGNEIDVPRTCEQLSHFIILVSNEEARAQNETAQTYFNAARSASNDAGPRRIRLGIMKSVITGEIM